MYVCPRRAWMPLLYDQSSGKAAHASFLHMFTHETHITSRKSATESVVQLRCN